MDYFSDQFHTQLFEHYIEGNYGGWYLGMSKTWRDTCLPNNGTTDGFKIILKDQLDGKLYESKIYVAYETEPLPTLDADYNITPAYTLMPYFYGCHHCPCNRKSDARRAGADTDDICEGTRFLVERIAPSNSSLILMSEVYSQTELEDMLSTLGKDR